MSAPCGSRPISLIVAHHIILQLRIGLKKRMLRRIQRGYISGLTEDPRSSRIIIEVRTRSLKACEKPLTGAQTFCCRDHGQASGASQLPNIHVGTQHVTTKHAARSSLHHALGNFTSQPFAIDDQIEPLDEYNREPRRPCPYDHVSAAMRYLRVGFRGHTSTVLCLTRNTIPQSTWMRSHPVLKTFP